MVEFDHFFPGAFNFKTSPANHCFVQHKNLWSMKVHLNLIMASNLNLESCPHRSLSQNILYNIIHVHRILLVSEFPYTILHSILVVE